MRVLVTKTPVLCFWKLSHRHAVFLFKKIHIGWVKINGCNFNESWKGQTFWPTGHFHIKHQTLITITSQQFWLNKIPQNKHTFDTKNAKEKMHCYSCLMVLLAWFFLYRHLFPHFIFAAFTFLGTSI